MRVKTHDAPTQTTTYASLLQGKDKSCQTNKKVDESTQFSPENKPREDNGKYKNDIVVATMPQSVIAFLANKAPILYNELVISATSHAFDAYPPSKSEAKNIDSNVEYVHCLIQDTSDDAKTKDLEVTCVEWGGATGLLLAATYGKIDEHGWCSEAGLINFWDLSGKDTDGKAKPFLSIEHSSYLMSVAVHPERPSMFSAGSFNGEILLFDINNDSQPLVACSKINFFPIHSLRWIFDAHYQEWLILSLSADGYILLWTLSNKLKFPIQGCNIQRNFNGELHTLGGTAMSVSARGILVGSESGALSIIDVNCSILSRSTLSKGGTKMHLKWSKNATRVISKLQSKQRQNVIERIEQKATEAKKRGVDLETVFNAGIPTNELFPIPKMITAYDHHIGPVTSVDCSPFNQNIFLSVGQDGSLKLYSTLRAEPILTFEPSSDFPAEHN